MHQTEISKQVIDGFRRGDKSAQETIYKHCYAEFMKVALRYTKSYDDAADLLHDSFIRIFTKADSYKGSGDFVGWMKRILINAAIDHCRLKQTRPQVEIGHAAEEMNQRNNEEKHYVADEHQLITLIRSLPEQQVLVFNLYVMETYSHQEIADALDISVANSKWLLFSARKTLKEKIINLQHG